MKKSESINELAAALAKAQSAAHNVGFDKTNPHYKSQYASLAAVCEETRHFLPLYGLAVVQLPGVRYIGDASVEKKVLTTLLMHSSGQWIEEEMLLNPIKDDPQGHGSAITYARRYALPGIGCFASSDNVDDDGEAASATLPPLSEAMEQTVMAHIDTLDEKGLRPYWEDLQKSFGLSESQSLRVRSALGKRRKTLVPEALSQAQAA